LISFRRTRTVNKKYEITVIDTEFANAENIFKAIQIAKPGEPKSILICGTESELSKAYSLKMRAYSPILEKLKDELDNPKNSKYMRKK
jgi:hypothetical protein